MNIDTGGLTDIITDAALEAYHQARGALADAIAEAEEAGHSANTIADRLSGSLGQPGVFGQQAVINYVGALRIAKTARKALVEAGLADCTTVHAMGPDRPIGAVLQVAKDVEGAGDAELPARIQAALAPALLMIHEDDLRLLGDVGLAVMITKMRPSV